MQITILIVLTLTYLQWQSDGIVKCVVLLISAVYRLARWLEIKTSLSIKTSLFIKTSLYIKTSLFSKVFIYKDVWLQTAISQSYAQLCRTILCNNWRKFIDTSFQPWIGSAIKNTLLKTKKRNIIHVINDFKIHIMSQYFNDLLKPITKLKIAYYCPYSSCKTLYLVTSNG